MEGNGDDATDDNAKGNDGDSPGCNDNTGDKANDRDDDDDDNHNEEGITCADCDSDGFDFYGNGDDYNMDDNDNVNDTDGDNTNDNDDDYTDSVANDSCYGREHANDNLDKSSGFDMKRNFFFTNCIIMQLSCRINFDTWLMMCCNYEIVFCVG